MADMQRQPSLNLTFYQLNRQNILLCLSLNKFIHFICIF